MKYLRNEEQAKDMSMQVYDKLTNDLHLFENHHFKSWLHVLTKNECLMHLRADKSSLFLNEKYSLNHLEKDDQMHHEYDTDKEVKLEQLEKAIEQLEDGQKTLSRAVSYKRKKLQRSCRNYRLLHKSGKRPYSKWQKKLEINSS